METPKSLVSRNVRHLREERKHTVRTLSALLGELGRPILPSGITKIEDGSRRVDVDDLVALAVALGVNPNRLLLPARADEDQVQLTPSTTAPAWDAWSWADGQAPLISGGIPQYDDLSDFLQHARPGGLREAEHHTAVRAARDVAARLILLLRLGPSVANPQDVRRALARLIAEVDDLIGGDDGDG